MWYLLHVLIKIKIEIFLFYLDFREIEKAKLRKRKQFIAEYRV